MAETRLERLRRPDLRLLRDADRLGDRAARRRCRPALGGRGRDRRRGAARALRRATRPSSRPASTCATARCSRPACAGSAPSSASRSATRRRERFGGSVVDWPAFPDSAAALARLAERYRLGVDHELRRRPLRRSAERLGVAVHLGHHRAAGARATSRASAASSSRSRRSTSRASGSCTSRRASSTTTSPPSGSA